VLEELHVKDLALIREGWLEFGSGLNVLSGETGAGKTVLVEALQLLVGERADSTLVRAGCEEALVEGRLSIGANEHAVRRRVTAEGRSKCYLDGAMATVGELAERLGAFVDLHGQHEHQSLLRASAHAGYLERFAGEALLRARDAYEEALTAERDAARTVATLEAELADLEDRRDSLRFTVQEVGAVGPVEGEDTRLEAELPRMRHGERLAVAASEAYRALSDDQGGEESVASALDALRAARDIDPELDSVAEAVEDVVGALDDITTRLRRYGDSIDHDPSRLNETEGRLASLASLKRKYGPTLPDVIETLRRAEEELETLEGGGERLDRARKDHGVALSELEGRGRDFAETIRASVPEFEERLGKAASDLSMGTARFEVSVEDLPIDSWTLRGPVALEFLYAPSARDAARPLARIASGGEVSRVMLALKGVLGAADETPVLVFDEIDAGVGGATALAVGRRLASLARDRQVIVITHLAQVAAFADTHLVVSKDEDEQGSTTSMMTVEGDERIRELARMLSGSDSATSLEHARELLASVGAGVDA
jgi:DNA repair protein RecN (Recombination protein N)